jgi:hypothetical protein
LPAVQAALFCSIVRLSLPALLIATRRGFMA